MGITLAVPWHAAGIPALLPSYKTAKCDGLLGPGEARGDILLWNQVSAITSGTGRPMGADGQGTGLGAPRGAASGAGAGGGEMESRPRPA